MKQPADVLFAASLEGLELSEAYHALVKEAVAGRVQFTTTHSKTVRQDPYMKIIQTHDGELVKIPGLTCLESHLPRDRSPTKEELEVAWSLCMGRMS
ncbi:MAG: hypothetical protein PW845_04810 [Pseudomonas sp.]|uniref:hypothetical protein n=1 Tax=Pseudomonas abieticivorans TaxID=2931382 RepID=UPI0020BE0165|nr:hypothetical protein [Pseudomonas sp. PIA16]MDE1164707.1 hypothetical protein [Pseudomonas sp.]